MQRNAEATKQLILDAAADEFSRHGFAGARIERIAERAQKNRALIYSYFENKEGLFAAVFERHVLSTTAEIPIDTADLPGYAVRLFDRMQAHPEAVRLAIWDRLERAAAGLQADIIQQTNADKVHAIAQAQAQGLVNDLIPATDLLDVIIALSRLQGRGPVGSESRKATAARRQAIHDAIAAIVNPRRSDDAAP
jgi:AcrR family transcriptional regulator